MNEGDAEQWSPIAGGPPAIGCRRFRERVLGGEGDHGVESGVQPLDPAEEMPRKLDTRNFAGSQAAA
jgi:hypothetical protein